MSTSRYTYAGDVGTGTTTDNMASRVKAWCNIDGAAAPATLRHGLNISSITDTGVGDYRPIYTAPFASASLGWAGYAIGYGAGYGGFGGGSTYSGVNTATTFRMFTYSMASAAVDCSPTALVCGTLA